MDVAEQEPFTFEQKNALRECRFVTTNRDRSHVTALTPDLAVAQAVDVSTTPYKPEQWSNPTRIEYELHASHPDAIAVAVEIMEARAA